MKKLLCIKNMRLTLAIIMFQASGFGFASPISCNLTESGDIHVSMKVPHPENAIIHQPSGQTIWLQSSPKFIHKQMTNFDNLKTWVINAESKGTVWINGKATIQPILKGVGKYHLYIAENTETERENTDFIECFFILEKNK